MLHCLICHTDYYEGAMHSCAGTATPCGPRCYNRTAITSANTVPAVLSPVKGCICPPTSEQTCQAADCPRKGTK